MIVSFYKEDRKLNRSFVLFSLAFAISLILCSCTAQEDIYSRPDEKYAAESKLYYEQDTVRYEDSAIMIELTYLPPRNLDLYFDLFKGGEYSNPFTPNAHMVFAVTMENLSDGVINYNPGFTVLVTEYNEPVRPKDYSSLYADFELVQAGDTEARMEAFKAACFDNSVQLQPGERVKKLLVFPREDEAVFGGVMLFGSVYMDYKSRDIPIEFKSNIYVK